MKKISSFLKTPEGKFVGVVALVIAILFGYYFYAGHDENVATGTVELTQTDHVRGAKEGKVTLVEFGDFQCPACASYESIVRQLQADNKDVLTFSFRHFPLMQMHPNALIASKAAEAAALQGKFWEMHDILYDKQSEWSSAPQALELFKIYANTLDLNVAKFAKDIESKEIESKILAELREGTQLGVRGTPTFFVNGKKIENPGNLAAFDKIIKEAAQGK